MGSGAAQPSSEPARSTGVGPSATSGVAAVVAARGGLLAQRPPQPAEREQRRPGAAPSPPAATARSSRPSIRSSSIGSGRSGARNGMPRSSAATTATSSSRFVRARIARVDASVGPGPHRARHAHEVVRGVGREDQPARRARSRQDPLRESLAVVLDEPDRALHDGPRAPVVRLEVDPSQARQGRPPGRGPVARRRAASRRSTGRRRPRGTRRWPAPRAAARAPAGSDRGPAPRRRAAARTGRASAASTRPIGLEEPERPDDEVVEVDAAELRDRPLVGDERARDRARGRVARDVVGRDAKVQLEPREREVQPAAVRPRRPPGTAPAGARRGRRAARSGRRPRRASRVRGRGRSGRGPSPPAGRGAPARRRADRSAPRPRAG